MERQDVVAEVAGSLRLEGLEPSPDVRELAEAWARGDVGDEDLAAAEERLLANTADSHSGAPRAA